jgi:hypothetical protein
LHTNPPGGIEKYYRDNVIGGGWLVCDGSGGLQFFRSRHGEEAYCRDRYRNCATALSIGDRTKRNSIEAGK